MDQNRGRDKPRIGCLGVGWIGRHRMQCVVEDGAAEVVAIADSSGEAVEAALAVALGAQAVAPEALAGLDLDGVMIATPSALHAEQSIHMLERGCSVFCQKPLARDAGETRRVIDVARKADRRLGVDFSYRHVRGVPQMKEIIASGSLGRLFAVELTFHNAYGPDKEWFYDVTRSGGGAVIDLGIHLVDLALWAVGARSARVLDGRCYAQGQRVTGRSRVEDYACARLELDGHVTADLTCSWNLHAGRDAVIEAEFYGTDGAVTLRNVDGSFYDFRIEHHRGTKSELIAEPPDAWGGRAAVAWARGLTRDAGYDPEVETALQVATIVDAIYGGGHG